MRIRAFLLALFLACVPSGTQAHSVTLTWVAPTHNTDGTVLVDLAGYRIYYGCTQSGQYDQEIDIPNPGATSYTINDLSGTCYFVATAYNSSDIESNFSNEAVVPGVPPEMPGNPVVQISWRESIMPVVALPVVETAFPTSSINHDVNLPSTLIVGERLLLIFSSYQQSINTPSGWVPLYSDDLDSALFGSAFIRPVDGTEGATVNVTTAAAAPATAQVYRIQAASDFEAGIAVTGAGDTINPPAISPSWGNEPTLYICIVHSLDDDATTTGVSANYGNLVDTANGAGANSSARTASARRIASVTTEDPGNWTLSESEGFVAQIIAVRGAPVGQALETDGAMPVTFAKLQAIGLAAESDSALSVASGAGIPIGLASESSAALAIAAAKSKIGALTNEVDIAFSAGSDRGHLVGLPAEVDTAFDAGHLSSKPVGLAVENDFAFPVIGGLVVVVKRPKHMLKNIGRMFH